MIARPAAPRGESLHCCHCERPITEREARTAVVFAQAELCSTCLHRELEYKAGPHPDAPRPVLAPLPDPRPEMYPGPIPTTIEEARAVLDGLGREYRYLPELHARIIFDLFKAAGLA